MDKVQRPDYTAVVRFTSFERRWLRLIFETVIPSGSSEVLPEGAADVPMEGFIDDLLQHAPFQFSAGLRACVWLLMFSPPFVLKRPRTFVGLSASERMSLLERLRDNDTYLLRELPLLFKTVGCLGFCGLPRVQARLGIYPRDEQAPSWAASEPELPAGQQPPLPPARLLSEGRR